MSSKDNGDISQAQSLLAGLMLPGMDRPAAYSPQIYMNQHLNLQPPPFTTQLLALEESARQRAAPPAFAYAAGSASTEATARANREAFDYVRIQPRMLRPVIPKRELGRRIFGRDLDVPVVMAPVGVQKLYHPEGEVAVARVFAEHGLPYTLSTASSCPMGDVANAIKENGEGRGIGWYQLYWPSDDELCQSYLKRAKEHGFEVLVVTLDTFELSWRPRDLDTGFHPFVRGLGVSVGVEDPVAQKMLGFDATSADATQDQKELANTFHVMMTARGLSPTWEGLKKLRQWWGKGPIVLKGIQCADDALKAVEYGMDGIVVSNHGGRQVDGAVGSLQVLPEIVDAVGGKITIGFDSGIRCGADIFKALAIGADFVQLGRPILWGLVHDGDKGVRHVLKSILADFDLTVGLAGCQTLKDVNRKMLRTQASLVPRL